MMRPTEDNAPQSEPDEQAIATACEAYKEAVAIMSKTIAKYPNTLDAMAHAGGLGLTLCGFALATSAFYLDEELYKSGPDLESVRDKIRRIAEHKYAELRDSFAKMQGERAEGGGQ